jgi:3',5'-nucleoside bisphosphate phosphatase
VVRVDLHLHSLVSDGALSPTAIVEAAAGGGLGVIALTDHDTAAGVAEAMGAGDTYGVTVIPAIEISTREGAHELHVLGYWVDPHSAPIVLHQETAGRRRELRMNRMIDRLRDLGVHVSLDQVVAMAGPEGRVLGRPHLARVLQEAGHTRTVSEAFDLYLGDDGPAYVAEAFPGMADAIALIHEAGGLAVWAHPPFSLLEKEAPRFQEMGLDGLEAYRPGYSTSDVRFVSGVARRNGLLTTGGSDWHGPERGPLGEFGVDAALLADLLRFEPGWL